MSEENKMPEPQWVAELKKWGIDVTTFREQWEQAGGDAKQQFEAALVKAQTEVMADKTALQAKVAEARDEVDAFVQRLDTAWDELVLSIQQAVDPKPDDADSNE